MNNVSTALVMGRIKILERLNAAHDEQRESDEDGWESMLGGYDDAARIACDAMGVNFGGVLQACDLHYLDQGIDRPMCGGVFLTRTGSP